MPEKKYCNRCADVDFEKTYPAHTAHEVCSNPSCQCHTTPNNTQREMTPDERVDLIWSRAHIPEYANDAKIAIKQLLNSAVEEARKENYRMAVPAEFAKMAHDMAYKEGAKAEHDRLEVYELKDREHERELGAEAERERILKLLQPCQDYCREVNGREDCKNCSLDLSELREILAKEDI